MTETPDECEQRPAVEPMTDAAAESEARRLLAGARAAHREAERERTRARKLGARLARKWAHALDADRVRVATDRAAVDARIAQLNKARSEFHAAAAADRARRAEAWADVAARQKRLTAEWEEANRFHADQAAALDARAADLAARESVAAAARDRLQSEVAALRDEAAALDARARNARQLIEELERRRADVIAPAPEAAPEPPPELRVALDRTADRDLGKWTAELNERDERLRLERAAVHALFATVSKDRAEIADRRRVLIEQLGQLAAARTQWQEAERATVVEMEQLARALRRREAELDARAETLTRADARRREDAYGLWQLRIRLEAWQSKLVAYEMRWHTEREDLEADFNRRAVALARRELALAPPAAEDTDPVPLALVMPEPDAPAGAAELVALRAELDRMAAVLLDTDLPERPDQTESELPWGAEEEPAVAVPADDLPLALPVESEDADVLPFEAGARAA
jgi:chromosome segregation ATPase